MAADTPSAPHRLSPRARVIAILCLAVVAAAVFARQSWRSASVRNYETLSAAADPLRARFNADAGQVRIVMLVAPT